MGNKWVIWSCSILTRLWNGDKIEEKTFMHHDNSKNVNLDTFNYIIKTVNKQCDYTCH